jgi:hypothetical protein
MGANLFDTNSLIDLYKANENTIEGYTTIINLIEYPKAIDFFYKLNVLYPSGKDYETSLFLSKELYKIGKPIPATDILLASICYNTELTLISKDNHFEYVKEIWNDFQIIKNFK